MATTIESKDVGIRFAEITSLIGRGETVLICEGDVAFQLVPPLPPLPEERVHTWEVYLSGAKIRDDFDEPMELVDSSLVQQ